MKLITPSSILRFTLLSCFALGGSAFAAYPAGFIAPNHFEAIGALGVANLTADDSRFQVTSSETDKLVQTNNHNWNTFAAQLGAGYVYYFRDTPQYSNSVQWLTAIEPELNVYFLNNNKGIKGDVWRFNSSAFNDLSYEMAVRSTRLMLDGALTVATWKMLSLYAIGGIGNAWNRLNYSDQDKAGDPCPEERLSLSSRTSSNFAWEVGAGLSYAFDERVALSLEYLFAHLGSVKTSSSANTGALTQPVVSPAHFQLQSQSVLLGIHIALG